MLGPVQLTCLGVGAIIGTGIFVLTGARRTTTPGPALMLSFVVAGVACIFAALCYAEFASMVPVAGSAYTYAYATLGELFAWIIGWDLDARIRGRRGDRRARLVGTLPGASSQLFGLQLPRSACRPRRSIYDPALGTDRLDRRRTSTCRRSSSRRSSPSCSSRASRRAPASTRRWCLKLAIVLFVIVVGAFYIDTAELAPVRAVRLHRHQLLRQHAARADRRGGEPLGMLAGAAIIFFAYIGFDSVSTHAEEAKNPARDVPIGIIASLVHLHGALHRRRRPC